MEIEIHFGVSGRGVDPGVVERSKGVKDLTF
jgi:hypothetical protein